MPAYNSMVKTSNGSKTFLRYRINSLTSELPVHIRGLVMIARKVFLNVDWSPW